MQNNFHLCDPCHTIYHDHSCEGIEGQKGESTQIKNDVPASYNGWGWEGEAEEEEEEEEERNDSHHIHTSMCSQCGRSVPFNMEQRDREWSDC